MLSLELELASSEPQNAISGFVLGHMTISNLHRLITSKGKQPDQAMMIFPSIVELLDGIRYWVVDSGIPTYTFSATDSSFQFTIRKEAEDRIGFIYEKEILDTVSRTELLKVIWTGVNVFIAQHGHLAPSDPVFQDLQDALEAFKNILN